MEEIWSPGIKTIASKCIGHAFISLWRIRVARGFPVLPQVMLMISCWNRMKLELFFLNWGTVSVRIRFNDMWNKTQNNNDLINIEIYFSPPKKSGGKWSKVPRFQISSLFAPLYVPTFQSLPCGPSWMLQLQLHVCTLPSRKDEMKGEGYTHLF